MSDLRLSTSQIQRQALNAMLDRQREMERAREEISTGRRLLSPGDDPGAAEQVAALDARRALLERQQDTVARLDERLRLEDATLGHVTDTLQRVRELTIRAGSAALQPADRQSIAIEIEGALGTLLGLANTRDGEGRSLFAGSLGEGPAFVRTGNDYLYQGDQSVRQVAIGSAATLADGHDGQTVFAGARAGNGIFVTAANDGNTGTGTIDGGSASSSYIADQYQLTFSTTGPGTSYEIRDSGGALTAAGTYQPGSAIVFAGATVTIDGDPADGDTFDIGPAGRVSALAIVSELATVAGAETNNAASRALRDNQTAALLTNLDAALGQVLDIRSDIGTRLQQLDVQRSVNDVEDLILQESSSNLRDVDLTEAIVRLETRIAGLDAAQQAFARIQGLSLFRFIS